MRGCLLVAVAALAGCSPMTRQADPLALERQVTETERAFAATMDARDHGAFTAFLSDEAIFFSGEAALRGKQAVADAWSAYFEGDAPPFSWKPGSVEVLDSGTLALSTGPVYDPSGTQIAVFTSIWRMEAPGTWRIVFDKGCRICENR